MDKPPDMNCMDDGNNYYPRCNISKVLPIVLQCYNSGKTISDCWYILNDVNVRMAEERIKEIYDFFNKIEKGEK